MKIEVEFVDSVDKDLTSLEVMTFVPRVGDTVLMALDVPYKVTEVMYKPSSIVDGSPVVAIITKF